MQMVRGPKLCCHDCYGYRPVVVGPVEIVAVAAMWSGIPIEQLTADEQNRLTNLEKMLCTCFIGLDAAVNAIADAVPWAHVGLKTPSPHCSFSVDLLVLKKLSSIRP